MEFLPPHSFYLFKEGDKYYVYSTHQAYLFEVDLLTCRILKLATRHNQGDILKRLLGEFTRNSILGALSELRKLVKAGIFSPSSKSLFQPRSTRPTNFSYEELMLVLTHDCNMNCKYCFGRAEYMGISNSMSTLVARKAVDFVLKHSNGFERVGIIFFGGEPLLEFPLIKHVVEYAKRRAASSGKHVGFSITTNGLLLTPEIANYLIENEITTMISFDGIKEIHDKVRVLKNGGGTFDLLASRIRTFNKMAEEKGISVQGRTTLTRNHLGRLVEHYEFMEKEMGFRAISTPLVHRPVKGDFFISLLDLPVLKRDFARLMNRALRIMDATGRLPFYGFFSFLTVLHNRQLFDRGCGAGRSGITVDVNGDIFPCERFIGLHEYKLGNVRNGRLKIEPIYALFDKDRIGAFNKCASCYAVLYCKSTCVAERIRYLPSEGPSDIECEIYRMVFREILKMYVRIKDKTTLSIERTLC